MANNLFFDFKAQDDTSDSLSNSVPSLTYFPFEESSPINFQSTNSTEHEILDKTKKIRKKRNAYHKIDDNIRLLLLEAVQRGETLKSAAKRYQVNYSSAKSIFHIYKKEGRILKKATQERDFPIGPFGPQSDIPNQFMPNQNQNPNPIPTQVPLRPYYQRSIFLQPCQQEELQQNPIPANGEGEKEAGNPLNDLVDNFSELLKLESEPKPKEETKSRNFAPVTPSRFLPRMMSPINQQFYRPQGMNSLLRPSNSGMLVSPAEKMRNFDNFYMNYSNSPLSGRNGKMVKEGSESGSNRNYEKEFESFSEMMNAFQSGSYLTESLKDFSVSKLVIPETPKEKMEVKTPTPVGREEDFNWGLEGAALDTYKSFVDAQNTLSNSFMKTPYYNNLLQLQKLRMDASPSPKFLSFPNH